LGLRGYRVITTQHGKHRVHFRRAVGLLRGSMIFICSVIEPGQPRVTMRGYAFVVLGADMILGRFPV